ncbi:hypothetical protein NP233_g425 [Leucocoprinus birnbaumii]|uniref:Uncharacterized protein n=1 Tax=Leucocoprinus birnbaumii TaxID=56174 RepID=A0AAD5W3T4_9AGAR|nr:hypothetical protein NP233_g425 [Leucocoprinus birnbaumii]
MNAEEDEYVETSDVEELTGAYGSRSYWSDFDEVDLAVEKQVSPVLARSPREGSESEDAPRKRRKLNHVASDIGAYVPSSQVSPTQPSTLHSQATSDEGESVVEVLETKEDDAEGASESKESKLEVDPKSGLQALTLARDVASTDARMDDGTVIEHVKAWASWSTPRKAKSSEKLPHSSQKFTRRSAEPGDYEGDFLNQFEHSLSPQVFSGRPLEPPTADSRAQDINSEQESEDELAVLPPKFTSPLHTSQSSFRASERNETDANRAETPLNSRNSSPLSPVESPSARSRNDDHEIENTATRVTASPRTTTTETSSHDDDGFTRYPLRHRRPNQLRPYTADKLQYKQALRHNPAAMINALGSQKRRADHPDDRYDEDDDYMQEESQQQSGTVPHDDKAQETQGEGARPPSQHVPAHLRPLSESSDDDSDDLAREARRIKRDQRRREKDAREKEEEEKRQRAEEERRERERRRREKEATRAMKRFPMTLETSGRPERRNVNASDARDASSPQRTRHSRTPSAPEDDQPLSAQPSTRTAAANEFEALRDYFMGDLDEGPEGDIPVLAEPEPPPNRRFPPPQSQQTNPPELVGIDDDVAPPPWERTTEHSGSNSEDLRSDVMSELEKLDPELLKLFRELTKLYPTAMALELLKGKKQQRSRRVASDELEENGPVLPGQSRIRRAANPKDVRDIRGDSESDDSDVERRSLSPQYLYNGDIRDFLDHEAAPEVARKVDREVEVRATGSSRAASRPQATRPPSAVPPEVIEISDEEVSSSSDEEQVDEEDIYAVLGDDDAGTIYDADVRGGPVKEVSMIDWMLSKTCIVGPTISRPKTSSRKQSGSRKSGQSTNRKSGAGRKKYKVDVKIRGARQTGNERQTLLSFENHSEINKKSKNVQPQAATATDPIEVEIQEQEKDQRKYWKQREMERIERRKLQGVYSMANPHTSEITSGRHKKPVKFTIDYEDDGFYQSFERRSTAVAADPAQAPKRKLTRPPPLNYDGSVDQSSISEHPQQRPRLTKHSRDLVGECTVDMGIEGLNPGVSFCPTSFIREGHLHALVNSLSPNATSPRPNPTYLCGLNLSFLLETDVFLQTLDKIFDGLLGLISELPSEGDEENVRNWDNLSRSACLHVTWFCAQYPSDDRDRLRSFIKTKVLSFISNLKSRDTPSTALNIALVSLTWFCLETSIRSGHQLFDESSGPLDLNPSHASFKLLLCYLMEYGFRKPYRASKKKQVLDTTKMPSFVAQVWVCLIYLLPSCDIRQHSDSGPRPEHPLWTEVLAYYETSPSTNFLETSEGIWRAVFTLMAFSEFSVFGVAGGDFQLPPSWNLVAYAISQAQSPQNNNLQHLARESMEKRDNYINVVISRCYRLLDCWKWDMSQSFSSLKQLIDIFRARNFVNLHSEEAEYPDFMLNGDWDSLAHLHPETDSAFTSILKLFMRAVQSQSLTNPEIRKMISLIIPVSRFRMQKEKIPGVDELSPICNRFAALVLAIAVEPRSASRTVHQVHSSIDFSIADSTTQLLTIRGIKLLATLMIKKDVQLQDLAKWLTTIISTVLSELKALLSPGIVKLDRQGELRSKVRNSSLLVLSLYATGRSIIETFGSQRRYPEPTFLTAFKPFLESTKIIEEATRNLSEMRRFIESYLDVRALLSPLREPILPTLQTVDEPESQDYGDFDFGIDLNDPSTLALLDGQANDLTSVKDQERGEIVDKVIFPSYFAARGKIWRFCDAATEPSIDPDSLRTLDSWAHCFIGCLHIVIQHQKTQSGWFFGLDDCESFWQKVQISWLNVRVQVSVYAEIIRYDPSFYGSRSHQLLELFFQSLTTHTLTSEPKYWVYVVANEASSSSLFKDMVEPLANYNTLVSSEISDTQSLRMSLVETLFKNIEAGLSDNSPQTNTWVEFCLKFLSAIRSNTQDFLPVPTLATSYSAWRKQILGIIEGYPRLKSHQRLKTILDLLS